jgi:hypothetical protein
VTDTRPENCRHRLQDENKPYPRSGCAACGKTVMTGLGRECSYAAPMALPDVTDLEQKVANPGSEEARALGCKCPVIDNHYGKGYRGLEGVFVYNEDCNVHADPIAAAIRAMGKGESQ